MEDPASEVPFLLHALTTSSPKTQRHAITSTFLPSSRFDHPLCHVPSSPHSRTLILAVYRWYKNLSPRIQLDIHDVTFIPKAIKGWDPKKPTLTPDAVMNGRAYIDVTQRFTFWFVPYQIDVRLLSVLDLELHPVTRLHSETTGEDTPTASSASSGSGVVVMKHSGESSSSGDGKTPEQEYRWYIAAQTDLYQSETWVSFFPVVGWWLKLVMIFFKWLGKVGSLLGAVTFYLLGVALGQTLGLDDAQEWILWFERWGYGGGQKGVYGGDMGSEGKFGEDIGEEWKLAGGEVVRMEEEEGGRKMGMAGVFRGEILWGLVRGEARGAVGL